MYAHAGPKCAPLAVALKEMPFFISCLKGVRSAALAKGQNMMDVPIFASHRALNSRMDLQ
jgi:hypothetical protein